MSGVTGVAREFCIPVKGRKGIGFFIFFSINMTPPEEAEFLLWVVNARAFDLLRREEIIREGTLINDLGVAKEKSTAQG